MSEAPVDAAPAAGKRPPAWWRWLDAVTVLALLPSLIAGTARWWWIGDLFVHFRFFYAAALLPLAGVYLVLRRPRWFAAVSVVLGINLVLLWPLFAPTGDAPGIEPAMKVMVANVFIGNHNPRPLLDTVADLEPDVLLLMEVDDRWMHDVESLQSQYPHRAIAIRDEGFGEYGPFGLAVFSRQPLHETRVHRLGTARVPIVVTRVMQDERMWTLVAAHAYPPVSAATAEARDTFLRELAVLIAGLEVPKVLVGDLNVTSWSPHFADLLEVSGLVDSQRGQGYQPTWPDTLGFSAIPIDHALVSPDVAVLRRSIGPSIASDHRPLIIEVGLRPEP